MYVRNLLPLLVLAVLAGVPIASSAAGMSTISVVVTGNGSVTSSPTGIGCPEQCQSDFSRSETVVLSATPTQNQTFLGWSGECSGVDPVCEVRANKGAMITAAFTSSTPSPMLPLPKTGSVLCGGADGSAIACEGTGQDGEFRAGENSPSPRFVDNGDGTVSDLQTGLTWTRMFCYGMGGTWDDAQANVTGVEHGRCGLSDGSAPGDWRLPNILELISLIDWGSNCLPDGHPFTSPPELGFPDFRGGDFWSATTSAGSIYEFGKYFHRLRLCGEPTVMNVPRTNSGAVWPVKIQRK